MQLAIAIGSAKGGAGASTLVRTMAVFLAQVGKRTALVDLHEGLAGIEAFAGMPEFSIGAPGEGFMHVRPGLQNLTLLMSTGDPGALWSEVAQRLGRSEYEIVIADLPMGREHGIHAVMRSCAVRILVTRPDPVSVRGLYARASELVVQEALERLDAVGAGRGGAEEALRGIDPAAGFASPRDLCDLCGQGPVRDVVVDVVRSRRIGLVVNHVQEQEDFDLGSAIESVGARVLGLPLVDLGHVEHDEAVEAALRRRVPLLVHMPYSRAGHDVEALARRILGAPELDRVRARVRALVPGDEESHYEALEVDRGSGEHEIRRAQRRIQEVFGGSTPATFSASRGRIVEDVLERARKAQRVLLDRSTKREYDRTMARQETEAIARRPAPWRRPADGAEPDPGREAGGTRPDAIPRSAAPPEGAMSGAWLASERARAGVSLEEMSRVSRISTAYLEAIEREAFEELPAPVYVRGFIVTYARIIGLEGEPVARSYMELMRSRPRG